jgi:MFS transporter, DHA2 family, multidrug resistance protein
VTYGIINAGETGWTDGVAVTEMVVGVLALVAFALWERRSAASLVDLSLFGSRAFTWGTTLSSAVSFTMFGLLFAIPLFFQVVHGADAQGSGIRLLPLIGGLLLGGILADRLAVRVGGNVVCSLGFALMAAGLALGATTSVATGDARAAAWIVLAGLGLGLILPTSIDAALGAVSRESSGVASSVLQGARMVAGAFGAAILGSIINSTYRDRLEQASVSPGLVRSARDSAVAGVDAATGAHSSSLLHAVRAAFVSGMNLTLLVSAVLMAVGAVLALRFMPRARRAVGALEPEKSAYDVAT